MAKLTQVLKSFGLGSLKQDLSDFKSMQKDISDMKESTEYSEKICKDAMETAKQAQKRCFFCKEKISLLEKQLGNEKELRIKMETLQKRGNLILLGISEDPAEKNDTKLLTETVRNTFDQKMGKIDLC